MRRIAAFALLLSLATGHDPALAQGLNGVGIEGNWACRANIDGAKAGLLTVYAGSYGYASVNYGSAASGTGAVEMASDGATFLDGNLVIGAGITLGVLSFDAAGADVLTLYQPQPDGTAAKPILTCAIR